MEQTTRVAIVTGAAGNGTGRSIALTLAREGFHVILNYRTSRESAEELAAYLNAGAGGRAVAVPGDIYEQSGCEAVVNAALEHFGRVDVCVIGPGAGWNPEGLTELEPEKMLRDLYQETSPVSHLLPLVLRDMKKRGWGRIIGISSNLEIPSPAYSYNAAKAARTQALLLAAEPAWQMGVTVNVIAPGPVEHFTDAQQARACCAHEALWNDRNHITPQDIAEGVAFLCSDAARYLTGCVLPYRF